MPVYDYRAKDRSGNTVTGKVNAADERAAADAIRELGQLPMEIRTGRITKERPQSQEVGSAFARYIIYPLWTGVNIKALALFYRQLATLLASGMSLSEGLRSIGSRMRGRLGVIIAEMQMHSSQGGRMSEVMVRYPKVFSSLQIALIRAGEGGGLLEQMIDRIASYLEYEIKIRDLIGKAIFYPIIILILAWGAFIGVPHMYALVNQGFVPFWLLIWPAVRVWIGGLVSTIVILKLVFQFDGVRFVWDCFKVYVPIVGPSARKIAMSRFSRALAVLYSAGMPMASAIDIAADACGNLHIGRHIKSAIPAVQGGMGLTEALTRTGAVTPMVLDMLSVGERSGSTDAVLQKVSDYMDEEVDVSIHKIGIALFVVMLLIAAGVVGYIVITFWVRTYGGLLGNRG